MGLMTWLASLLVPGLSCLERGRSASSQGQAERNKISSLCARSTTKSLTKEQRYCLEQFSSQEALGCDNWKRRKSR